MEVGLPSQRLLADILWPWILCVTVSFGPGPREAGSPSLSTCLQRCLQLESFEGSWPQVDFQSFAFLHALSFPEDTAEHAQPFVQVVRHTTKMLFRFVFFLQNLFAPHYGIPSVRISSTNWALDRHVLD